MLSRCVAREQRNKYKPRKEQEQHVPIRYAGRPADLHTYSTHTFTYICMCMYFFICINIYTSKDTYIYLNK
jgi:hypothetical protein